MQELSGNFKEVKIFITEIRRFKTSDTPEFNTKLAELLKNKLNVTGFKTKLTEFCFFVFDYSELINAFTEYGVLSNRGFFPEIYLRLKHKLLPLNYANEELVHVINFVFDKPGDYLWLNKINNANWERFFDLINTGEILQHSEKLTKQLQASVNILCHRLTAIGIDQYLLSKIKEGNNYNSVFFELDNVVMQFINKHFNDKTPDIAIEDLTQINEAINRAENLFNTLQKRKDEIGTSLHLTYQITRAKQIIKRIQLLLRLITSDKNNKAIVTGALIVELVKAEQTKNNLTSFVLENTSTLAYRIVSHASEKGEHYIGFTKSENIKLFKSAMGGGLVVVFLVYIKQLIHDLHLSLFFEGLLFGLNYGIGFVLMHLWHFTLATKQPAMTAAYIANSIDNSNNSNNEVLKSFKQILKSQLISLIGNLIIVLPLCFLSAWVFSYFFNYTVFSFDEAKNQLYSNHPLYSASLIFACIAGFFLSLAGVVIGYIDNKVVYSEIPQRIVKHPKMIYKFTFAKREKIALFIEKNLGAILGNLFLGFCLGMAGNMGKFIGIPFDIRHVTISSGNYGIALGSGHSFALDLLLTVFFGIILIGIINIATSFLISFILACGSRKLSWKQSFKLLIGKTIEK
ncbi:MAG: hypothetical protein JSU07_04050 [Bacteroidetes bacterium]|nr:hypothetical protein [Bacteroidota bacterium]